MRRKRIRHIIESDLRNVPLVGGAINQACAMVPLSGDECFQIELCAVEAINNCIIHAYDHRPGHEIEVILTIYQDRLVLSICDTGTPMEQNMLERNDTSSMEIDVEDVESIPEGGRGLFVMKAIMDSVEYVSKEGKNCLTLVKNLPPG